MKTNLFFASHIILLAFICPVTFAQEQPEPNPETAGLQGEAREIADWVFACQKAGWEDHDIDTYLSQWADDATVILARGEETGEYDIVYDHDQIVATRTMRMRGETPGIQITYGDVEAEIDGDTAIITCETLTTDADSNFRVVYRARYTLKRFGDEWRVVEDREWYVSQRNRDQQKTTYTQAQWEELDRAVTEAQQDQDVEAELWTLFDAMRFQEAYDLTKRITQLDDAQAADWSTRGYLAVLIGDAEDAQSSFEIAYELDSEVRMPPFVLVEEENDEDDAQE